MKEETAARVLELAVQLTLAKKEPPMAGRSPNTAEDITAWRTFLGSEVEALMSASKN